DTKSDNDKYLVFVLNNDGMGAYYSAPAKDSPIPETIDGAKLTWEMDEGGDLYIAVSTYTPQM
ncbi:MAG: hypothetical protein II467_06530, partial [Bacilli bacterium]|nr:hypothetical protein [Bacilli bacterium]